MVFVKKRNGQTEPFIPEKIVVSVIKAGAPPEIARMIEEDIYRTVKDGISTREIKRKILSILRNNNPEWERRWIIFESYVRKETGLDRPYNSEFELGRIAGYRDYSHFAC